MCSYTEKQGIYYGKRGNSFKNFIKDILKKARLKQKYREMLTDESSMKVYSNAFTSETVHSTNNYQVLEQLGDLTGNKFIVNYMYQRFSQLNCTEGVKIVARLRINYGAKESFSEIARKLGFWEYISASNDIRSTKMKPLLEDVFEAFIGATEMLIDKKKRVGVGYAIVYDILSTIFDEMDISLKYEDLYDSKTRLKELFDCYEEQLGPLEYKDEKLDNCTKSIVYRINNVIYQQKQDGTLNKKRIIGGEYVKLGEGYASLKIDAQKNAASAALRTLNTQGYRKQVPDFYIRINDSAYTKEYNKNTIIQQWGEDMNILQRSKEKRKHKHIYMCTPLSFFCRKRNFSGIKTSLELGANPNIVDSDGMYPVDLLFIGKVDNEVIYDIISELCKYTPQLYINKDIMKIYVSNYIIGDNNISKFLKQHLITSTTSNTQKATIDYLLNNQLDNNSLTKNEIKEFLEHVFSDWLDTDKYINLILKKRKSQ